MVQLFGSVERSIIKDDGTVETVYRIPAVSETTARGRARGNNRLKGLRNPEFQSVEPVADADIPGQTMYEVVVESSR